MENPGFVNINSKTIGFNILLNCAQITPEGGDILRPSNRCEEFNIICVQLIRREAEYIGHIVSKNVE